MQKILILDDEQIRHDTFAKRWTGQQLYHVYTIDAALRAVNTIKFDLATLDHDLGEDATGMLFLDRMMLEVPKEQWPFQAIVHSHNPVGALNMLNKLRDMRIFCAYNPFTP
jgi:CheY-like chemotaxis protein